MTRLVRRLLPRPARRRAPAVRLHAERGRPVLLAAGDPRAERLLEAADRLLSAAQRQKSDVSGPGRIRK